MKEPASRRGDKNIKRETFLIRVSNQSPDKYIAVRHTWETAEQIVSRSKAKELKNFLCVREPQKSAFSLIFREESSVVL